MFKNKGKYGVILPPLKYLMILPANRISILQFVQNVQLTIQHFEHIYTVNKDTHQEGYLKYDSFTIDIKQEWYSAFL